MQRFQIRYTLLLVVLASMAYLPAHVQAQVADTTQTSPLLQQARDAITDGRYSDALTVLQPLLLGEQPTNVDALLLRARAFELREEVSNALADFNRVLQLEPTNIEAIQGAARMRQRYQQRAQSQLDPLRRQVEANPSNVQLRFQYAQQLYEAQLYRQAADEYEAYLQRVQGTPDVIRRYLTAIASYEGDHERGANAAERYLQIYPTNDDLWMRLGYFRLWLEEYEASQEAFERALQFNPQNPEAPQGLELAQNPAIQSQVSNFPIDILQRELAEDPDNDQKRLELVDLFIEYGRFFEAKQNLEMLEPRLGNDVIWQDKMAYIDAELAALEPPPPAPGEDVASVGDAVDQLFASLRLDPTQDERRFELVEQLIVRERYFEAYEQLVVLEELYGTTDRWLGLFKIIDDGLIEVTGSSPVYAIDRFTYLLRFDPLDQEVRFALVDSLMASNRVAEAYAALIERPPEGTSYLDPTDPEVAALTERVVAERRRLAQEQATELEAQLAQNPNDPDVLKQLGDRYLILEDFDQAVLAYQRSVELDPTNTSYRLQFAQTLLASQLYDEALFQMRTLTQLDPTNDEFRRTYAITSVVAKDVDANNQLSPEIEQLIAEILDENPNDTELLMVMGGFRLWQGDAIDADNYLRLAYNTGDNTFDDRIEVIGYLVERDLVSQEVQSENNEINLARLLVRDQQFQEALATYEAYFDDRNGDRTRQQVQEVAQVHAGMGDYLSSLAMLNALQEQYYTYEVEKDIAFGQFYRGDFSGAVITLEGLLERNPRDFEAIVLLGDSYRELNLFAKSLATYNLARRFVSNSPLIEERIELLETRVGLFQQVNVTVAGSNFGGVIGPEAIATVAEGSGTRFSRWTQGAFTQISIPAPVVLTGGIRSHFLSGTRRLIPGSEEVSGRVNEVYLAGRADLTPPVPNNENDYTNRLTARGGFFDFEGGRTAPHVELGYLRHHPALYTLFVRGMATEGATELWSPGGGQFELRLNQLLVRGTTASVLPDSVLRLMAQVAFNSVSDNFRLGNDESNFGTNIIVDASYRVIPFTYLGITYNQLSYKHITDIYFSPRNYAAYDMWLEYKRWTPQWALRVRGGVGLVARSNGFVSTRLEGEWSRRLTGRLSFALGWGFGRSSRSVGNQQSADSYTTATVSGQLYIQL